MATLQVSENGCLLKVHVRPGSSKQKVNVHENPLKVEVNLKQKAERGKANKELITSWTKDYYDAVHPHSAGGAYINFMMEEGEDSVKASYKDNYDRLVRIKNRYDPTNLFRVNQNIKPSV